MMTPDCRAVTLLKLVLIATAPLLAKAKDCTIKDGNFSSKSMKLDDKNCATFSPTPCEKAKNWTELTLDDKNCTTFSPTPCKKAKNWTDLRLSHNKIREVKSGMFSCMDRLENLYIDSNLIRSIQREAFNTLPFPKRLKLLDLRNNQITSVHKDAFNGLQGLSKLYLQNNGLRAIAPGALDGLVSLNHLNLNNNELQELPIMHVAHSQLATLEASSNPIKRLDARVMGKYSSLMNLYLKETDIELLPDGLFRNNSALKLLSLGDSKLNKIEKNAFKGTKLLTLELVRTKISELPGEDLKHLSQLFIKGVKNLWTIPIVSFQNLENATVEYPFHCCLIRSEVSYRGEVGTQESQSTGFWPTVPTCPTSFYPVTEPTTTSHSTRNPPDFGQLSSNNTELVFTLPTCVPHNGQIVTSPSTTHQVNCTPNEDAFNPCGDLLNSLILRICSWIVVVFALLGNIFKLLVLLISKRRMPIYKILMCNLALANLCMGVYLCMLVSADLYSSGAYQNFAREWQYRSGCKAAGFLSIFSTELAAFVLTVITIERYFMIVYPLNQDKHLNTNQIIVLITIGWLFSLTMAALPLCNISSYEKVAICLPFDVERVPALCYVTFLLATNGLSFFFVLFCYGRMYCSLGGSRSHSSMTRVEGRVAKRMAMLVLTNFACWFPIALVSLIAIYGKPLVNVKTSQFFLVFVYPINSFTNPYLYAIGTKHFQLDALEILREMGICHATVDKLSSRLRDQLETFPNSSRTYTGSKLSLNSIRSPQYSPGLRNKSTTSFSSRWGSGKSNNNTSSGNSDSRQSLSSKGGSSCSPCHLTAPLIHKKRYDLPRLSSDSRVRMKAANMPTKRSSSSNSLDCDTLTARRSSAREIDIEGRALYEPVANDTRDESIPSDLVSFAVQNSEKDERQSACAPEESFQVPKVTVTSC